MTSAPIRRQHRFLASARASLRQIAIAKVGRVNAELAGGRSGARARLKGHPEAVGPYSGPQRTRPYAYGFKMGIKQRRTLAQDMSHLPYGARQRLAARQLTGRLSKARTPSTYDHPGPFSSRSRDFSPKPRSEHQQQTSNLAGDISPRRPCSEHDPRGADHKTLYIAARTSIYTIRVNRSEIR